MPMCANEFFKDGGIFSFASDSAHSVRPNNLVLFDDLVVADILRNLDVKV